MELRYTYIPNLYWGNGTTDKPLRPKNPQDFIVYTSDIKINWLEPHIGKIKVKGIKFNYCYLEGKFYFAEPIKWFGNGLVLYRLVSDFWTNYWLNDNLYVRGTLATTNSSELVLANINQTLPLIDTGNTLKFINIEEDADNLFRPPVNTYLYNISPWHSYYDSTAVKDLYKPILARVSTEADNTGAIPREKLLLPAVLFTNHKFKWWVPYLTSLVAMLKDESQPIKVYKPPTSRANQWHNFFSSRIKKDRKIDSYVWVGFENIFSDEVQQLSTHQVKNFDFSTLEKIEYLGRAYGYEPNLPKPIPKKPLGVLSEVVALNQTESTIQNFTLEPIDPPQTYKFEDTYYQLTNFKLGEIKNYARKTVNGEVKKDGKISVLVGLKNLDQVKNWEVEITQADFLDKHGIYQEIAVKKGEILIPLSKYKLVREKAGVELQAKDYQGIKHLKTGVDLLALGNLDQEERAENKTALFGDDWTELEALVVKPEYYNNTYTYGYLTIEPYELPQPLEQTGHIYIAKIQAIPGKDYENKILNPRLNQWLTKRPLHCELFQWFFNYFGTDITSCAFLTRTQIYFLLPKRNTFSAVEDTWKIIRDVNANAVAQYWANVFRYVGQQNGHSDVMEHADFYYVNHRDQPIWTLDKFLRDWDDYNNTDKWAGFLVHQHKNPADGASSYTLVTRYYKGKPYYLMIGYDSTKIINFTVNYRHYYYWLARGFYIHNWYYKGDAHTTKTWSFKYPADIFLLMHYIRERPTIETYLSRNNEGQSAAYWFIEQKHEFQSELGGSHNTLTLPEEVGKGYVRLGVPRDGDEKSEYLLGTWKEMFSQYGWRQYKFGNNKSHLSTSRKVSIRVYADERYTGTKDGQELLRLSVIWLELQTRLNNLVEEGTPFGEDKLPDYGHEYITVKSEIARNPKDIDFSKFRFDQLSNQGLSYEVEVFDFENDQEHIEYFDLKGTEWILMLKKTNEGAIKYGLIAKDPSKVFEQLDFIRYRLNPNLIINDPIQVVNQFNTLHFFGQEIPLKARARINNFFKFDRFQISPLNVGIESNYEYKWLELKTEVDDIKKAYSHLALVEAGDRKLDPFTLDNLRFNQGQAELLREHARTSLNLERAMFQRGHEIKEDDIEWKYFGQGQRDWKAIQNFNWNQELAGVIGSAVGTIGSSFFSFWNYATLGAYGAFQSVMSLGNMARNIHKIAADPKWQSEVRAREHERDMAIRQHQLADEQSWYSYVMKSEKMTIENEMAKRAERNEIMSSLNSIKLTDVNDVHIHKALTKKIQLGDIYLSTTYPEGWLYEKLREYYDRHGFDVIIKDFVLNKDNMGEHINIKFSYIEYVECADSIIREYLTNMFLQGIRLRND